MRITLWAAAVACLAAAVTNALTDGWHDAVLYLLLALAFIGWSLAEQTARTYKQVAEDLKVVIRSKS